MKLIVGFGNPESKYNFTRHNFGFLALDFYAKVKNLSWEQTPKFNALWAKTPGAIFIKPQTYYNDVGSAIQDFTHFYKIPTSDILIICDDFNLDFGKIRFREKGSAGGNNGLKSTISSLGTDDFPRLRLGTDNASRIGSNLKTGSSTDGKIPDIDFVLSKFTKEEKDKLPSILRATTSEIDKFLAV